MKIGKELVSWVCGVGHIDAGEVSGLTVEVKELDIVLPEGSAEGEVAIKFKFLRDSYLEDGRIVRIFIEAVPPAGHEPFYVNIFGLGIHLEVHEVDFSIRKS